MVRWYVHYKTTVYTVGVHFCPAWSCKQQLQRQSRKDQIVSKTYVFVYAPLVLCIQCISTVIQLGLAILCRTQIRFYCYSWLPQIRVQSLVHCVCLFNRYQYTTENNKLALVEEIHIISQFKKFTSKRLALIFTFNCHLRFKSLTTITGSTC
jgi:hypothetical protein